MGKPEAMPRLFDWRAWSAAAKVTVLCYALYVCMWMLLGAALLAYDHAVPTVELSPGQAEFVGAAVVDAAQGEYVTVTDDAQMLFSFGRVPVRRVLLEASFAQPPGELDAYYGFLFVPRRAFARPVESGYEYTLVPKEYEALRIDLGTRADNAVAVGRVVLNPRVPVWRYFAPDARGVAAAVALPALASSVICYIMEVVAYRKARRGPRAGKRQISQGDLPDAE